MTDIFNGQNIKNFENLLRKSLNDIMIKTKIELDEKIKNNSDNINNLSSILENVAKVIITMVTTNKLDVVSQNNSYNKLISKIDKLEGEKIELLKIINKLKNLNNSLELKISNINVNNKRVNQNNNDVAISNVNNKRARYSSDNMIRDNLLTFDRINKIVNNKNMNKKSLEIV